VAHRLAEYDERTKVLIDRYRCLSRFHTVDGYRPMDVVFGELVEKLEAAD
jgi:adenylate kinase family enzyme